MPRIPRPRISKRVWLVLAGVFGVLVLSGGSAVGALAATGHLMAASGAPPYCVTFGHGAGAAGNVVENNWDNSPTCPAGTYPHTLKVADSDTAGTGTDDDSQFLTQATDNDSVSPADTDNFLPTTFNTTGTTTPATTWTVLDYHQLDVNGAPKKFTCRFDETNVDTIGLVCVPA